MAEENGAVRINGRLFRAYEIVEKNVLGIVAWWNGPEGFGIIRRDREEYLVHASDLYAFEEYDSAEAGRVVCIPVSQFEAFAEEHPNVKLEPGENVCFSVANGENGPVAVNILRTWPWGADEERDYDMTLNAADRAEWRLLRDRWPVFAERGIGMTLAVGAPDENIAAGFVMRLAQALGLPVFRLPFREWYFDDEVVITMPDGTREKVSSMQMYDPGASAGRNAGGRMGASRSVDGCTRSRPSSLLRGLPDDPRHDRGGGPHGDRPPHPCGRRRQLPLRIPQGNGRAGLRPGS